MKYQLLEPVIITGDNGVQLTEIKELDFTEKPKAKHFRGIVMRNEMLWDDSMKLAARLCGQSDMVMGELSFADMNAITLLVGGFLAASGPQKPQEAG